MSITTAHSFNVLNKCPSIAILVLGKWWVSVCYF